MDRKKSWQRNIVGTLVEFRSQQHLGHFLQGLLAGCTERVDCRGNHCFVCLLSILPDQLPQGSGSTLHRRHLANLCIFGGSRCVYPVPQLLHIFGLRHRYQNAKGYCFGYVR